MDDGLGCGVHEEGAPVVDFFFLLGGYSRSVSIAGEGVSFELELKIMHVIRLDLFVVNFVLSISLSLKLLILLFARLATHGSLLLIIQVGICW